MEIPAWSIPGKYNVLKPRIRCQRVKISISVWFSMCPMCRDPVTLGGGMTIEKTDPGALASARKSCSFTQNSAQRDSICCGSYAFAISRGMSGDSPVMNEDSNSCSVILDYTGRKANPSTQRGERQKRSPLVLRRKLSRKEFSRKQLVARTNYGEKDIVLRRETTFCEVRP